MTTEQTGSAWQAELREHRTRAAGTPDDELHQFNLRVSEAIAPTWERRRGEVETVAKPVREWILRELAPQPGETVLELAAGVGETGFEAAAAIGEGGRLICTDIAPSMLDAARRRGAELGVRNVEYRVVDAERMDLEAGSVDAVICRYGLMLMPDAATAVAETRRVLRAGGRLVAAVWGAPQDNPFFAIIGGAMAGRGHIPPPDPQAAGIFSLGDPARLRALLSGGGFEDVRIESLPVRIEVRDVQHYLEFIADTAGAIGLALRRLNEDERTQIAADAEAAFAPFAAADGGFAFPGVTLGAVAR